MKSFLVVVELNLTLKTYFELGLYVEKKRLQMTDAVEIVKLDFVWALEEMKSGAILDIANSCYAPCTTLQAFSRASHLPLLF